MWFDFILGEGLSKLGNSFDTYMEAQAKIPTEERIQRLIDNDAPLSIYMKKKGQ